MNQAQENGSAKAMLVKRLGWAAGRTSCKNSGQKQTEPRDQRLQRERDETR